VSRTSRAHDIGRRPLTAVEGVRAFRVSVIPGRAETFGVVLEETYGQNGHTLAAPIVSATAAQTARVVDAVITAVRGSGHAASILAFGRKAPIKLGEPEGVLLALVLLATQPVSKHARVRALVAGINAMSTEESYYWYSKCIGVDGSRARKALRTLLAED